MNCIYLSHSQIHKLRNQDLHLSIYLLKPCLTCYIPWHRADHWLKRGKEDLGPFDLISKVKNHVGTWKKKYCLKKLKRKRVWVGLLFIDLNKLKSRHGHCKLQLHNKAQWMDIKEKKK
jgi:hypothetical protein